MHKAVFRTRFWIFFLVLILGPASSIGQVTTTFGDTAFHLNSFNSDDIIVRKPSDRKRVYAANRIPENADELPNRTYVITQDEILANGYTTLPDILKTLPGFRTSQPGSALLGETFLMRGLLGNNYTKILINGMPVTPSAAPGMPIGAQLPIKQAERIEIILGPASSLYGADAMAGVINIVLPDVERPVEAMASVGLGSFGTDEIHISLAGKTGKDKNVLQYNFYGSSRRSSSLKMDLSPGLFEVDSNVLNSPLFVGEGLEPSIEDLPHESRLLGVKLKFRGLSVNANSLFRRDHSAIGSHPEEVSYHDPTTFTGENIYSVTARFEHTFKNSLWLNTNASYLYYKIDEDASYYGISHPLSNGVNYMHAFSEDYFVEQLAGFTWQRLNFLVGASMKNAAGDAFQGYLQWPFEPERLTFDQQGMESVRLSADSFSLVDSTAPYIQFTERDYAAFGQIYYKSDKLNVIAGIRYDKPTFEDGVWNPKLGAFYRLTRNTHLRAFFGSGFRIPSAFYRHSSYSELPGTPQDVYIYKPVNHENVEDRLIAESLTSFEAGVTHHFNPWIRGQLQYFSHTLKNSLFPILKYPTQEELNPTGPPPPPPSPGQTADGYVGFRNARSTSILHAFQVLFGYTDAGLKIDLSGQYSFGEEHLDTIFDIEEYRSVPELQFQLSVQNKFSTGTHVAVHALTMSDFLGTVIDRNGRLIDPESAGYTNIDFIVGQQFTDNFSGYLRLTNLTNAKVKGLYTNAFTGYDFDYMPQLQRIFYFGLTYKLN